MTLGMMFRRVAVLGTRSQRVFAHQALSTRYFSNLPPHTALIMPALSPTMEEGVIAAWQKKVGDEIAVGDVLCDIETDKATVDYEMIEEGFLARILVEPGTAPVKVGEPIAVMVENEDDIEAMKDVPASEFGGEDASASSDPAPPAPAAPVPQEQQSAPAPTPAAPSSPSVERSTGERVIASPYARKIAREIGVAIENVVGTGPGGRIIKSDVDLFATQNPTGSTPTSAAVADQEGDGFTAAQARVEGEVSLASMAAQDASWFAESKNTVPHYYLNMKVNAEKLLATREQLNAQLAPGTQIAVNDFVIRACAIAMRKFPAVNSAWVDNSVREFEDCDVNVAMMSVAGVVRPVIRDVNKIGLAEIAAQSIELYELVNSSDAVPATSLAVGTFTVSNFGEYGVTFSSTIVHPMQSAALNIGQIERELVPNPDAKEGESNAKIQTSMPITLSCDHRVVDGAVSAQFLQEVQTLLENPIKMLL